MSRTAEEMSRDVPEIVKKCPRKWLRYGIVMSRVPCYAFGGSRERFWDIS
jgi:hypothetical protein